MAGVVRAEKLRSGWDTFDHHKPDLYLVRPHPPEPVVLFDREAIEAEQEQERLRAQNREAQRRWRQQHPEENRRRVKEWRQKPEVKEHVAAYNQTYYDQKKQDPEWLERRRARDREAARRRRQQQRQATT